MTNVKEQGGLKSTSQVTSFLTELLKIIGSLSSELKRKAVSGMAHLIEDDAILEAYFQSAKELFSQMAGGKRPLLSSSSSNSSQGQQGRMPPRSVVNLIGDENIEDMGSKRARQMLQRTIKPVSAPGGNSNGPVRNDRSVLMNLKALELPGALSVAKAKTNPTKRECQLCYDLAGLYRAICGHLCCKPCWSKIKICPNCRVSFTMDELQRVDIVHHT